jgi:hypothetical protein
MTYSMVSIVKKTVRGKCYYYARECRRSLVPSQHPDLLAVARERFGSLAAEGLPGVSTYRCKKEVFGKTRAIVVTYNERFFVAQSRTLLREIAKRQRLLGELQAGLQRRQSGQVKGGKPPTMASTRKKIDGWLTSSDMKELFEIEISEANNLPVLNYRFREESWQQLQATRLGKTILFSDQEEWSAAQIVRGYRSQHHVEAAFRDLKNIRICRYGRNGTGRIRRSACMCSTA